MDGPDPFWEIVDPEDAEELKASLEEGNMSRIVGKLQQYIEKSNNVTLSIAITGNSGSGKSTFVNAFRGLGDEDEGSAKTDVVETTMEATPYPHPKYPNVLMWDLPGIGTPRFKPEEYLTEVEFERYDFFILVSAERFTDNDVKLAMEIKKMNKKFYFVRSKIDASLYSQRTRKTNFDEVGALKKIKEDCISGLEKQGMQSPQVFLISSFELGLYDFPELEDTLEKELPKHQRHVLLMAIPNFTLEINRRKKKAFKDRLWQFALLSGLGGAVPVPGLSFALDVSILVSALVMFYKAFGLDGPSLEKLAKKANMSVADLRSVLKCPLNADITSDLVVKMLSSTSIGATVMLAEEFVCFIPIVGSVIAGGISYRTTSVMLDKCLNDLADDAQNVILKALDTLETEID